VLQTQLRKDLSKSNKNEQSQKKGENVRCRICAVLIFSFLELVFVLLELVAVVMQVFCTAVLQKLGLIAPPKIVLVDTMDIIGKD
jgi:uncharacterized membrane protein